VTGPQQYARLSVWRALGGSVDAAGFGIREAWRWTPGLLLRLMLTTLVVAVTPAAQVLVLSNLVRAADLGQLGAVVPPLVILVLLVGATVSRRMGEQATKGVIRPTGLLSMSVSSGLAAASLASTSANSECSVTKVRDHGPDRRIAASVGSIAMVLAGATSLASAQPQPTFEVVVNPRQNSPSSG
jgi:hypothetical protein